MRKNTLMVAAAIAALTAGSSMAFAQGAPVNPAAKNAPAEKMAPAVNPGGAAQHTPGAQRSEEKSAPANRMGQAPGDKAKETTGQAPKDLNNKDLNNKELNNKAFNERNDKMGEGAERNKSKAGTTGQAPSDQRVAPKSDKLKDDSASERNRATTGQGAPENRNKMENRGGAENSVSGGNRAGGSTTLNATVNLSGEQKTKIHSIIVSERSAPRVSRVDFSVNVGTIVPRTVRLAPIPTTIVEIEPTWRGFQYFLVGDQLVVVDPATLQIVAVLPA